MRKRLFQKGLLLRFGKPIHTLLALGLMTCFWVVPAKAAELIMMEQKACQWCERWHAEIGPIYPKTDEGKRAPLRSVDIHEPMPDDLRGIRIERFTPSFVLVEDGVELGRIRGYPGDELFWWMLSDLIKKLPASSPGSVPPLDSAAPTSDPLALGSATKT
ncbi:transcriptional regulator [Pararhizobium sp. IMCC21322]|uniref:transcriptional regulator n=1 Tax=Pararhizobium sp. IMCC21322 TaxID=3067903 RepID=UPI002740769B|nr:transcriptional regulator [Pararhizobium sp. IMCC21322]